jgi:hypothetical protein
MEEDDKGDQQSIYKSVWHAMHPAKVADAIGLSKLRDDMVNYLDCRSKFKVI